MSQKYLIYDSSASGHHTEFIEHLLQYLIDNPNTSSQYVFVVHAKICDSLFHLLQILSSQHIVIPISTDAQQRIDSERSVKEKVKYEAVILRGHIEVHRITHLIFMYLDDYQFLVAKWAFSMPDLSVSGILFMPAIRMSIQKGSLKSVVKSLLERIRDFFPLLAMSCNKNLDTVYILNDDRSIGQLNRLIFWNRCFKVLPDPIPIRNVLRPDMSSWQTNWLRTMYKIEENKHIFLCLGSIDKRKNIINILKSLLLMTKEQHQQMVLLILGKCFDMHLKQEIETLIAILKEQSPAIKVIFDNRFLTIEEMEYAFEQSDVVLIPYLGFYFSSGILGHAAKYNKYIIASEDGVIGDLVKKYHLGATVDPNQPKIIAQSIQNYILNPVLVQTKSTFLLERSTDIYARALLQP